MSADRSTLRVKMKFYVVMSIDLSSFPPYSDSALFCVVAELHEAPFVAWSESLAMNDKKKNDSKTIYPLKVATFTATDIL